jgi:glycosyltransferase involved in cell wall biosynthesis
MNELYNNLPIEEYKVLFVYGDSNLGKYLIVDANKDISVFNLSDKLIYPVVGDIFISVDLTYNITQNLIDELTEFKNNGINIFFIIYDLIPIRYPEWFEGTNEWFEGNDYLSLFNYWFENIIKISNGIICISDTVKCDVESWIKENKIRINTFPKLDFFHLGSDIESSLPSKGYENDSSSLLKYIQNEISFLVVGTIEPRKGHQIILDVFESLWAKGININLFFVGKQGWKVDSLINNIIYNKQHNNKLFWLNNISDEYLEKVYENSTALLLLSKVEGFGLPLIEAANKKLPLILSNIKVFNEICGKNAYYIDIENDNLEEKLIEWIDLYRKDLHPKSENINVLTWNESTIQLLNAIEKIIPNNFKWIEK